MAANFRLGEYKNIKKITTLDELYESCKKGDILNILSNIKHINNVDLNICISNSLQSKNIELISMLISMDLNFIIPFDTMNCEDRLKLSCEIGNIHLAKLMILKGAKNFIESLKIACKQNYPELVKLMVYHGANNFDDGLKIACQSGNINMAKLFCEWGARITENILKIADCNENKELYLFLRKICN